MILNFIILVSFHQYSTTYLVFPLEDLTYGLENRTFLMMFKSSFLQSLFLPPICLQSYFSKILCSRRDYVLTTDQSDLCFSGEGGIFQFRATTLKIGTWGMISNAIKDLNVSLSLPIIPSVPLCLSSILFSDVPKYCPVSKNKSH